MRRILTPVFVGTALTAIGAALLALWPTLAPPPRAAGPATVTLAFAPYSWRPAGDFRLDGRAEDAPLHRVTAGPLLVVMQHQVIRGEYSRCVEDKACLSVDAGGDPSLPQTHVSWQDATAMLSGYRGKRARPGVCRPTPNGNGLPPNALSTMPLALQVTIRPAVGWLPMRF